MIDMLKSSSHFCGNEAVHLWRRLITANAIIPAFIFWMCSCSSFLAAEETKDILADLPLATPENQKASQNLYKEGQALEKATDLKSAIGKWEEGVKLDARNWTLLNHFAWFLGVSAPAEFRNTKMALTLALQSARITGWKNKDVIDSVAEIYFQCGDFAHAVETQKKL